MCNKTYMLKIRPVCSPWGGSEEGKVSGGRKEADPKRYVTKLAAV